MLKEKLMADLKQSMKSADQDTVGVLRILISAIKNKEIDKKTKTGSGELNEDEILQTLMTEAKKRKESIEVFNKGGRQDLAGKEEKELSIIQKYLPEQLSESEIEKVIESQIKTIQEAQGNISFGNVMKEAMGALKGKADGKIVGAIVKKKLAE